MRGKFITFEGIDGSGKSTQLRMLASELRVRGFDVLTTCEPGGTPLGRRLREVFLETEETVAPLAELLLFAADRAQHVYFLVEPALENGKIVISDRYSDATAAYQGAGRGFDEQSINQVIRLATGGLKPDLTLFFDISVNEAISRTNSRSDGGGEQKNRMDSETVEFYERVRKAYLQIAENEPERFCVVDASGAIDEIKTKVLELVTEFLKEN
ncbi:MAG: dTMP kinase [Acidobacteria bacterium]|nr:dTMP kinase [Pyrinomonadaceae bacterium]MBA3785137.1 dTMP kinase [Acidobacteriota bacterium]